jgi:hypothetical protein
MKTIGIVGSRRRNEHRDFLLVEKAFLDLYKDGDSICSGHCPKGADRFAEELAEKYSTEIILFPPDWKRYGRGAGIQRNTDIAERSDYLIACVASDRTGGTEDTIRKFIRAGRQKNLILV